MRGATPDWNITSPIRINKGRGNRINLDIESYKLRVSCTRPISPPRNKYAPMRFTTRKQKAMGSPVAIRITNIPKMNKSANCHSNGVHLLV
jgi:hypothetical protein